MAKDYIEREAAIKRFTFATLDCLGMEPTIMAEDVVKALKAIPAADVRHVVRGEWRLEREPDGTPYCFHCSVCDDDFSIIGITTKYNYCPNCGALMDKDGDGDV